MSENKILIRELLEYFSSEGNFEVNAYYKIRKKVKVYYDFTYLDSVKLRGSYDVLPVLELIYYIDEQSM